MSSITAFKLIYLIPIIPIAGSFLMNPRLIAVRYYRKEMLEAAKKAMEAEDQRLERSRQGKYDQWIRSADRKRL